METATFSDFIPIALTLHPDAQGYLRLPTKFYEKYIKNRKSIPTTALLKEEQRDLSWYVDTSVQTKPKTVDSGPAAGSVSKSAPLNNCYQSVEYAPPITVPRAPRSPRS